MEFLSHSEAETEQVAQQVARRLCAGTVLALFGDLGVGKTAFTRGLAHALGYRGRVTSPTFTIVNEYEGELPIFHFDLYRLPDGDALYEIGWEDYLLRGGICVVEWSERAEAFLPSDCIRVTIRRSTDEQMRSITVEGEGFA